MLDSFGFNVALRMLTTMFAVFWIVLFVTKAIETGAAFDIGMTVFWIGLFVVDVGVKCASQETVSRMPYHVE